MDAKRVEGCIEALCEQGCQEVRRVIRQLETGDSVPETARLSADERATVLAELRAIMAVYDARPPGPEE